MATFGLACNVMLWSVPALVGAAGLPHAIFPTSTPSLPQAFAQLERSAGPTPSLLDALMQIIGAEAEALEVAGAGLQQPTPPDLGQRANHAGARVLDAISTYIRSASEVFDRAPRH